VALDLALGAMGRATLLASQRVVPRRLAESGFRWEFPELEPALRAILRR
jgi:NAD dependent epimerase/dehydratase family enzyme